LLGVLAAIDYMNFSWWNAQVTGWPRFLVGRRPAVTGVRVAAVLLLYFGFFRVSFQPIRVAGVSMEPNYHDGQLRLLNARVYRSSEPQRGDVVAIRPQRNRTVVLKRIVALPGERVSVRSGGRVYVNGELLEEPYVTGRGIPPQPEMLLGSDQYFAIGDNRSVTLYDVVRRDEILGRAK
jgi:signal peptidase I